MNNFSKVTQLGSNRVGIQIQSPFSVLLSTASLWDIRVCVCVNEYASIIIAYRNGHREQCYFLSVNSVDIGLSIIWYVMHTSLSNSRIAFYSIWHLFELDCVSERSIHCWSIDQPYFFHSCLVFFLSSILTNIVEC